ncbi:MAG: tRNA pseudouridine(38-40) synthase TruA [Omnitrophica WOR_2 bacterium GWA2_47_8]|nr:MAG: tRNA pseudouridine(38-40) synthase TruA [Omnitrophica WOR_2 bacterium GWA2_47_8]
MRNIKLIIEYDGTSFHGWQIQNKKPTVQGELKKALKKILREDVTLISAGRTDSGVHALGQVTHFKTRSLLGLYQIKQALNAHLPPDISITEAEEADKNFHAQYHAKTKTYRYTILNRRGRSAYMRHFCLHHPYPLNTKKMKEAAKFLIGRRNFRAFQSNNPSNLNSKDTIRTIKRISISKKSDFVYIDIEADGFLYKMVRNIVGVLLEVGNNRLAARSIKDILKSKNRTQAKKSVAAQGLCLLKVKY